MDTKELAANLAGLACELDLHRKALPAAHWVAATECVSKMHALAEALDGSLYAPVDEDIAA